MANTSGQFAALMADCNAHVVAWLRHVELTTLAAWERALASVGAVEAFRRAPGFGGCVAAARNEAAWREITDFLSSEPRRGSGDALAPAGRS